MKLGFLTGVRSEYGVMRQLIQRASSDNYFQTVIYATGMHFQHKYGDTINEIKKDNFSPIVEMPCYTEEQRDKKDDFISLINAITDGLSRNRPELLYVIGDRLEAYAGALAAHFLNIPVAHFAGGQITKGAVDNIYRYNISNLSTIHFVTNKYAFERLKCVPIIDSNQIFLTGSSTVDNIYIYLKQPKNMLQVDSRLERDSYVLMTFHPQTIGSFNVAEAMDFSIRTIIDNGGRILVTYPNNDNGSDVILEVIHKWENNANVIAIPNLGSDNYYSAIDNSMFVVGNSSSGVIEVPYFRKFTINVGQRQSGRNAPKSVINTESDLTLLQSTIVELIKGNRPLPEQECIYGTGNSIDKIIEIIKTYHV